MRTASLVALVLAVAAFAGARPVAAADGTFSLKFEEAKDPADAIAQMGTIYARVQRDKPESVKVEPKGATGRLRYYQAEVAGHTVVLAIDESDPPKLYADSNGNGDFSDDKPVAGGKAEREQTRFAPVTVAAGEGKQVFSIRANKYYAAIGPAGYYAGDIKVGDKTFHVALIDSDGDGRYDSMFSGAQGKRPDLIAIDFDGNGHFEQKTGLDMEVLPLSKQMALAGGFYEVAPAPDGTSLTLAPVKTALGTLDVGEPSAGIIVTSDTGVFLLRASEKGAWQLPTGSYRTHIIQLEKTDADKAPWRLTCSGKVGKLETFAIKDGETLKIAVGAPLVAKAEVAAKGDTVSIGCSLAGRAGEEYSVGAGKDGKQMPAPSLSIVDENGKELASGKLEYG